MSTYQFEPMSVGGILDRAFGVYRRRFARCLAVTAVVIVPLGLLRAAGMALLVAVGARDGQENANRNAVLMLGTCGGLSLGFVVYFVGQQLATAAMVKTISEMYLGGDATVGEAYRFALRKWWRVPVAAFLSSLALTGGLLLCIVPGVIFALWFCLSTAAIVVEDMGSLQGMARSKYLVRGNMGKAFVVFLVVWLIAFVARMVLSYASGMISVFVMPASQPAGIFVQQAGQVIPEVLTMPLQAAAAVLLYYDLRIRKEGFDLEMLARSLGAGEGAGGQAAT